MNISSTPILDCNHKWISNKGMDNKKCFYCNWYSSIQNRTKCSCLIEACIKCVNQKYPTTIIKPIPSTPEIPILELKILKNRISILEDTNKLIIQRLDL